jgi:hypothetical protein
MTAPDVPSNAEEVLDSEGLYPQAVARTDDPFSNGHGFVPGLPAPEQPAVDALWLVFSRDSLLLDGSSELPAALPDGTEGVVFLGRQNGREA